MGGRRIKITSPLPSRLCYSVYREDLDKHYSTIKAWSSFDVTPLQNEMNKTKHDTGVGVSRTTGDNNPHNINQFLAQHHAFIFTQPKHLGRYINALWIIEIRPNVPNRHVKMLTYILAYARLMFHFILFCLLPSPILTNRQANWQKGMQTERERIFQMISKR